MVSILFFTCISFLIAFWIYRTLQGCGGIGLTTHTAFLVYFLLVPGYLQFQERVWPWPYGVAPNEMEVVFVLISVIIYVLSFSTGNTLAKSSRLNRSVKATNYRPGHLSQLALAVALLSPSAILISLVGLTAFFESRGAVGDIVYSQNGFIPMLYAFAKFTAFAVLMFLIIAKKNGKFSERQSRKLVNLSIFLAAVINFVVNNPLSSPRYHFLSMLIALYVALFGWRGRKSSVALMIFAPIFLYLLFPYTKYISSIMTGDHSERASGILSYLTTGVDYDCFRQMVNIVRYVDHEGFSFGSNFFAGVAFTVPRLIWPDKPENLGILSATFAGFPYTNLSAPIIGELYFAIGWLAVMAGGILTGKLIGEMDRSTNSMSVALNSGGYVILSSFIFIIYRGSFSAVFPPIAVAISSYWLLCNIGRVRFIRSV